jgi:drug/metabolite transporter (DMT)-like permease
MGQITALMTALCWAITSILFSITSKKVGSMAVNRLRLLFASVLLLSTHWIVQGQLIPLNFSLNRWMWLGLSGIIGLILGDAFLFQAYVMIGARLSTVMMALSPVASAILAWMVLGERLNLLEVGGIAVTVAGVTWVVLEKQADNGMIHTSHTRRQYLLGILCGIGGVLGQAFGLILSKRGLEGGVSPLSGVLIRIIVAAVVLWLFTVLRGQVGPTLAIFRQPKVTGVIATASVIGPFIGVWLSLVSVQLIPVGIASTLQSLSPIFVLPMTAVFFKEKVTSRATLGTLAAIAGVAVLSLAG